MKTLLSIAGLFALLFLSGCMPGPNIAMDYVAPGQDVAGFWQGLWHGFICILTFIISLFNDNVQVYEVVNNGMWYNLGFLIGASSALGGSGAAARR